LDGFIGRQAVTGPYDTKYGKYVEPYVSKEAFNRLYKDIKPEDLLKYGKSFPLSEYFTDMLKAYEKYVIGG
jgi:hypothetical protein